MGWPRHRTGIRRDRKAVILYLTYNDQPSGVYWSQVTDVVAHLNTLGGPRVRLLALVSIRDLRTTRRKIRAHCPDALVLPMVPQMKRWRSNAFIVNTVCRLLRPSGLMARGALGTWMALRAREKGLVKKVCFDARGAYAAEWEEYRIIDDDALIAQFRPVEKEAVERSDFRLAVSQALVDHWRERYGYAGIDHVVIPCTLGKDHLTEAARPTAKRAGEDVVLVYSGSTAGWQSFELLESLLKEALTAQPQVRVLFLSRPDPRIDALGQAFPGRVDRKWVTPDEVAGILAECDHGVLVREDSITNRVASPTKFAEYLRAGLKVVAPEHLGDVSARVEREDLGCVWRPGQPLTTFQRVGQEDRQRLEKLALTTLTKSAFDREYLHLLEALR